MEEDDYTPVPTDEHSTASASGRFAQVEDDSDGSTPVQTPAADASLTGVEGLVDSAIHLRSRVLRRDTHEASPSASSSDMLGSGTPPPPSAVPSTAGPLSDSPSSAHCGVCAVDVPRGSWMAHQRSTAHQQRLRVGGASQPGTPSRPPVAGGGGGSGWGSAQRSTPLADASLQSSLTLPSSDASAADGVAAQGTGSHRGERASGRAAGLSSAGAGGVQRRPLRGASRESPSSAPPSSGAAASDYSDDFEDDKDETDGSVSVALEAASRSSSCLQTVSVDEVSSASYVIPPAAAALPSVHDTPPPSPAQSAAGVASVGAGDAHQINDSVVGDGDAAAVHYVELSADQQQRRRQHERERTLNAHLYQKDQRLLAVCLRRWYAAMFVRAVAEPSTLRPRRPAVGDSAAPPLAAAEAETEAVTSTPAAASSAEPPPEESHEAAPAEEPAGAASSRSSSTSGGPAPLFTSQVNSYAHVHLTPDGRMRPVRGRQGSSTALRHRSNKDSSRSSSESEGHELEVMRTQIRWVMKPSTRTAVPHTSTSSSSSSSSSTSSSPASSSSLLSNEGEYARLQRTKQELNDAYWRNLARKAERDNAAAAAAASASLPPQSRSDLSTQPHLRDDAAFFSHPHSGDRSLVSGAPDDVACAPASTPAAAAGTAPSQRSTPPESQVAERPSRQRALSLLSSSSAPAAGAGEGSTSSGGAPAAAVLATVLPERHDGETQTVVHTEADGDTSSTDSSAHGDTGADTVHSMPPLEDTLKPKQRAGETAAATTMGAEGCPDGAAEVSEHAAYSEDEFESLGSTVTKDGEPQDTDAQSNDATPSPLADTPPAESAAPESSPRTSLSGPPPDATSAAAASVAEVTGGAASPCAQSDGACPPVERGDSVKVEDETAPLHHEAQSNAPAAESSVQPLEAIVEEEEEEEEDDVASTESVEAEEGRPEIVETSPPPEGEEGAMYDEAASSGATPSAEPEAVWVDSWPPREAQSEPPLPPPQQPLMDANGSEEELEEERRQLQRAREEVERLRQLVREQEQQQQLEQQQREHDLHLERERVRLEREQLERERQRWQQQQQEAAQEEEQQRHHQQQQQQQQLVGNELQRPQPEQFVDLRSQENDQGRGQTPHSEAEPSQSAPTGIEGDHGQVNSSTSPLSHDVVPSLVESSTRSSQSSLPPHTSSVKEQQEQSMPLSVADAGDSVTEQVIREEEEDEEEEGDMGSAGQRSEKADAQSDPRRSSASSSSSCRIASVDAASSQHAASHDTPQPAAASASADSASSQPASQHTTASTSASTSSSSSSVRHLRSSSESTSDVAELASMLSQHRPQTAQSLRSAVASLQASLTPSAMAQSVGGSHGSRAATPPAPPAAGAAVGHSSPGLPLYPPPAHSQRSSSSRSPSQEAGSQRSPSSLPPPAVQLGRCGHPGRLPERSSYISRTPSLGSVQRDGQAEAYDGDVLQSVSGAVSVGGHTPRANSMAVRSHTPSVAELLSAVLGEVHVAESDSSSDRRDGEDAEGKGVSAHATAHQQSSTPTADDGKRGGSASRRPSRHRDAGPAYATSLLPKTQLALQVMRARSTSLPGRSLSPAAPVTYDYGEEEAEDELPSVAFPVSIYAGFGGAAADAGVGTRGGANESDEEEAAEGDESGHGEWLPSGVFDARDGAYGAASPGGSDGDKDDDCARTVSGGGTEERADWTARDGAPDTQHETVPALNSNVDASGLGGAGELREKGQPVTAEAAAGQDGAVGLENTDSSAALRGGDRVNAAAPAEEGRQDDKGTGGRASTTGGQGGAHPDGKTAGSQDSQRNTRDGTSATPASKADGEEGEEEKEMSGADAYQHPQRHGAGERRSSEPQPSKSDGREGTSGLLLATPNDRATASSGSRDSASSRPERRPSRSSADNVPQTALPAVATTTTTASSSSASSSGIGTSPASSRSPAAEAALKGQETGSRVLQDGAGEKGGVDALDGSTVGVDVPHHDAPQARPLRSSPPSGLGQGGEGHSHAAREQTPHAHSADSGGRGAPPQPSAASTDGNHHRASHPPSPLPERHTVVSAPVAGTSPPPQRGPAAAATPYPNSQRSDTADEAGLPSVDMPLLSPREASDFSENPPRPARSRQLRLAGGDATLAIAPVPALNTSSTHAGQHSTRSDAGLAHHGSADVAIPYPADCADGGVDAGAVSSAGVRTPASSALPREGASLASYPESVQWGSAAAPSWQRASRHRTSQLDYDIQRAESGDGGVPLPPHVFGVGQPQPPHRRRPSRTPRLSDLQSSGEDDRAAEREEGRREASSVLSSPAVDEHYLSITRDRTPGMDRDSRGGWAAYRPGEGRDGREPTQAPADSRGTHEPVERSPMTGAGLHRYAPRTRSPLAAMPSTHPYCYRDLMDGASAVARVPSSAFHPAVTAASASADKGTHLAHSPHLVDSAQQQQPSSLPRSLLGEKRAPTPGSSESESRAEDDKTSDGDGHGDDGGVGMVAEPGSRARPHRERTRGTRHHDPATRHRRHNKHHRPHRSDGASAGKHDGHQGTEQDEEQSEGPAHRRDSHRKKEKRGHHAVNRGAHQHSDDNDGDVDRVREAGQGSGAGPTTPPPPEESRAPRMAGGGIDPRDSRYVAQEAALSPTVGRLYADPRYSPTHPYDWQGTTPSLLSTPQQGRLTGRDAEAAVAHSEKAEGEDGVVVVPRGDGSERPRRPHRGEHKPHRSRRHHRHRPSGVGSGGDGLQGGHSASPSAPDSRSSGSSRSSSARSPSASSLLADDGRGSHRAGTRDEARKDEQGHTAPSRRSSKLAGGSSSQSSPPQPRPPAQPRQHGDGAPPPYDRERSSAKAAGAQEEGPAEAEAGVVAVPASHQLEADGRNTAGEEEKETGSSSRHRRTDQPSRSRTHRHAQPVDALAPPSPAGREDDDSHYDKKDEENASRPASSQHASPGVVRAVTPWTASASSPPHVRHEHAVQQPMPRGAHRHAAPVARAVAHVSPSEGRPGELYYCDSDGAFHRIENDDELREVLAAAAAAGGRDRPPLYVVHHPGSSRALSPQAGRSVSPTRQQQASPPRRVWTITDPKAAIGCSRLNPYCATCRQKYNLIFVDAQMRPLRWPSPRSKELEAMGDCRTHSGYVFAAADADMGSDATTVTAAFSRQPTLGERRERALYTREWPELTHVRADQLLVSEEDVDRPLRQLTPPPRGRFVPVSYTTQESGVPLRQPVAYTHGRESRSRSGAARDASGQPTTRSSRREGDSGWRAAAEAKRSVDGRPGERSSDFSYGDADGALLPPSRGSPALRERQRAVRPAYMPSPIAKEGRSRVSLPPSSLSSFPTNSSSSTTMDRRGDSRSSQVDGDQHGAAADAGSPTDRREAAQRKEERRIKKALKQLLWRDLPQQRGSPEWERYMQSLSRELRQQNLL